MISNNRLAIVFPVYSEELVIEKTILSYYNEFKDKLKFVIIVTEDGSKDNSKEILLRLKEKVPIQLYMNDVKLGYLNAIKNALRYPQDEWVFLVDSDYQFDPKDFWKLQPYMEEFDIILGKKINRQDGIHRLIIAKIYNFLLRLLFNVPFSDMDTGFRLFKNKCIKDNLDKVNYLSFFTAEFVIRSYYSGYKIKEVPVKHLKREGSQTSIFSLRKLPLIVIREFFKVLNFYYHFRLKRNNN
jgi:glycosyltransferase involved in cell wall biosynthesis